MEGTCKPCTASCRLWLTLLGTTLAQTGEIRFCMKTTCMLILKKNKRCRIKNDICNLAHFFLCQFHVPRAYKRLANYGAGFKNLPKKGETEAVDVCLDLARSSPLFLLCSSVILGVSPPPGSVGACKGCKVQGFGQVPQPPQVPCRSRESEGATCVLGVVRLPCAPPPHTHIN